VEPVGRRSGKNNRKNSKNHLVETVTFKEEQNTGKRKVTYNIFIRSIIAFIFTILIFSSLSYSISIPVYIIVPIVSAFITTFLIPRGRKWSALPIILSAAGCVFFAPAFENMLFTGTHYEIIMELISGRQAEILTYTPLLFIGLLGGFLGWGIASLVRKNDRTVRISALILMILFSINFIGITLELNPSSIIKSSYEPVAGEYNNYNSVYIKTFYLMKRGTGFYDAFANAYSGRFESSGRFPETIGLWRMPAIFYIWVWFLPKDGFYIFYLYQLLCIGIFCLIFDISKKYLEPPLNIIPVFLTSYLFIYGAVGYWFAFPEFWGFAFMLLGIWGIYRENTNIVFAGFLMSILIRSIFIIPWAAVFVITIIRREEKYLTALGISGLLASIVFFLHYHHITVNIPGTASGLEEMTKGSSTHLWNTFSFGAVFLSRPILTLALISVLFIISIILMKRDYTGQAILASILILPVTFLKIGPETYRDYWGVIYMPLILMCACYFPSLFEKHRLENEKNDSDRENSGEIKQLEISNRIQETAEVG
jgi:hypothetical protein